MLTTFQLDSVLHLEINVMAVHDKELELHLLKNITYDCFSHLQSKSIREVFNYKRMFAQYS